jgi:hypothetical protein
MSKKILVAIVVCLLIYIVYKYVTSDVHMLTGLVSGEQMQKVEASALPADANGNTVNFTYSIWFFIDDWNYKYGEKKVIFGRMTKDGNDLAPCPVVTLQPVQNVATIELQVAKDALPLTHTVAIPSIPIQRWVNLTISTNTGIMDVYMDGKLIRTSMLPGVPLISPNAPVYVTPDGGFSGWTSNFQYWANSIGPNDAWHIYKKGYGGSWLSNIFGRYSVKVSVMEGDTEESSFTI